MTEIPDLWPTSIDIAVPPPSAIIRRQASLLRQHTQGVLEAEAISSLVKDNRLTYEFRIIAPPLEGYTYALFRASHDKDLVYPVAIS